MKRRTGLTGLRNPGLELEMLGTRIQISGCSRYQGLAENRDQDQTDGTDKAQLNRNLLNHFRELAAADQDSDQVDLDFLDQLISDGADPNSSDRFGQTVLHEVSRAWSVDVMRFFLDRGSDLHHADQFGVTALHVASALDYEDMVQFLLEHKADPESRTFLDLQTPLHFASKNDSLSCIKALLRAGASISAEDYKKRTPLQLAACTERSAAARLLLDFGAEAGLTDSDGQLCITAMIGLMSPVAQLALSQFHVTDRMTRQQYFYLNLLEPEGSSETHLTVVSEPTSPLQVVVQQGKLDLIMNPVFLKLIQVKWNLYGSSSGTLLSDLDPDSSSGTLLSDLDPDSSSGTLLSDLGPDSSSGTLLSDLDPDSSSDSSSGTLLSDLDPDSSSGTLLSDLDPDSSSGTLLSDLGPDSSSGTLLSDLGPDSSSGTLLSDLDPDSSSGTLLSDLGPDSSSGTLLSDLGPDSSSGTLLSDLGPDS
ncbi:hypothetical protein JOQ06_016592 [Pogonophryne albipinna]|uniref:Uncharacterized protein n=1 Tax=Pogonophryne albipinna TaxID=1090488 RepID=A0AAD6ACC8_9TELE|nr:hypothetical protein JOQ06_016592 [Pogonophryne albipinna]